MSSILWLHATRHPQIPKKLKQKNATFVVNLSRKFLFHLRFNSFRAIGLFLYPLKTSQTLWFSDVFRGYRKRPVA